ncbi:MAG: hypothetical protein AMS20_00335 [Gemmatimonas sp. SG8_28]|jgi:hypothetical protein|nr:MAG: hypothetical protein AMS20_00335 [Gemmatimonas sp. SG8_28]
MPAVYRKHVLAACIAACASAAPAQAQDGVTFGIDGELRLRGEWDRRTVGIGADAATLSRIRVGGRASLTEWMRVYARLQDARAWGTEGSTLTDASADQLDMHQVHVELGTDAAAVRLGRQEVALGDERLVGAVGWSNTGRVFDGARVLGTTGGVEWQAFWMNVAERDSLLPVGLVPQGNQGIDDDGWLIGGFAATTIGGISVELTALVDRDAETEESYTANVRAHGSAGPLRYDAGGAYQFGPNRSAYFASTRLGIALGQATVAVQGDLLSGDDDPAAGDAKAFHTLYGTNHKFYGYMDYFLAPQAQLDQAGLGDVILRGSLALPRRVRVRADVHRFWTARERFGSRALGSELDLIGDWGFHDLASLEVGVGIFAPTELATRLIPAFAEGDDLAYWGYVQLIVRWPGTR